MTIHKLLRVKIESVIDYLKIKQRFDSSHGKIFRGQSNRDWKLSGSLEREEYFEISDKNIDYNILDYYITNTKDLQNRILSELDRTIIIQHYGGKTRLLDFTRSIDIALFFAIHKDPLNNELSSKDSAIWILDSNALFGRLKTNIIQLDHELIFKKYKIKKTPNHFGDKAAQLLSERNDLGDGLDDKKWYKIAFNRDFNQKSYGIQLCNLKTYPLMKRRMPKIIQNERIRAQKSVFIYPMNFSKTIEQNLFELDNPSGIINDSEIISADECIKKFSIAPDRDKLDKAGQEEYDKTIKLFYNTKLKLEISSDIHEDLKKYLESPDIKVDYLYLFPEIENSIKYNTRKYSRL